MSERSELTPCMPYIILLVIVNKYNNEIFKKREHEFDVKYNHR